VTRIDTRFDCTNSPSPYITW